MRIDLGKQTEVSIPCLVQVCTKSWGEGLCLRCVVWQSNPEGRLTGVAILLLCRTYALSDGSCSVTFLDLLSVVRSSILRPIRSSDLREPP